MKNYRLHIALFLFAFHPSISYAKFDLINATKINDNKRIQNSLLNKPFAEMAYFKTIYMNLAYDKNNNFIIYVQDKGLLRNTTDSNTNGGFIPEELSKKMYSSLPENTPEEREQKIKLQTSSIIYIALDNYSNNPNEIQYGIPYFTIVQEFFHAYQYAYYKRNGNVAFFLNPNNNRVIEIEGDLFSYLSPFLDELEYFNRKNTYQVEGMEDLLMYFRLKHFDQNISETRELKLNQTLHRLWIEMKKIGYGLENDLSRDPVDISNFEALPSIIRLSTP
ncbi:MAG: hypothetical protein KDD46_00405 [Bdellovibrionales bacterium]|nr:hypothetical protein [Bdellovibrionales bacterium]